MSENKKTQSNTGRAPIVSVVGHIDHGKSTLLDYIRKTNVVEHEAGGITQHTQAYKITHKDSDITFIDTPGHAAFKGSRERGANIADMAVLVVSAEEGAKEQTLECLKLIEKAGVPFIVAINKIDRPNANVEKTKQGLAEASVMVEGYGGKIPCVEISAKDGTGIDELLDMILLLGELEDLSGNPDLPASGYILESHVDPRIGVSASLIIKDGSLKIGDCFVSDSVMSKVKRMEDMNGSQITSAGPSEPARICGLSEMPISGTEFMSFDNKNEAEDFLKNKVEKKSVKETSSDNEEEESRTIVPIVIKSDVLGTLEALIDEISKLDTDRVKIKILQSGLGNISESDLQIAESAPDTLIIGFNVKTDKIATDIIESQHLNPHFFNVIYKVVEFLDEEVKKRTPKIKEERTAGKAKIIRVFNQVKKKQVIGATLQIGVITDSSECNIIRNDNVIGRCRIHELQVEKVKVKKVEEKINFGALIDSKITLSVSDTLEPLEIIES